VLSASSIAQSRGQSPVRLDADVLAWLRSQGKGYQTRINQSLRREMLTEISRK
jgi:uncharacterized protein (DUF4415 family)